MRVILLLCLICLTALLTLAPSAAQRAAASLKQNADIAKYIGLRHGPTLPPELKSLGESLVSAAGDTKEYGMAEIHRGTTHMLWFEDMTHVEDKGIAYWEVKDVMVLPRVPKKQVLAYYRCFLNNRPDGEIAAVLDYESGVQYFTRARAERGEPTARLGSLKRFPAKVLNVRTLASESKDELLTRRTQFCDDMATTVFLQSLNQWPR